MTSSPTPGNRFMRWLNRSQEAQRPAPKPDPADMGTCFGLELSMDDSPLDPFSRSAKPLRDPDDRAR